MTTLHLGDCLNGCATCAENYHSNFAGQTCDTCNNYCEEARFSCGSCGYQFAQSEGVTIQEGTYSEFVCTPCYEGEGNK